MAAYLERIRALIRRLPRELYDPEVVPVRPRTPTQAFSEFLINREQGDWAEGLLQRSINEQILDLRAVKYGRSEDAVAGDPTFKDFFKLYYDELEDVGKRPDILLFDRQTAPKDDLNERPARQVQKAVSRAIAGLEVRSSAFVALPRSGAEPNKSRILSITPKAEDLRVIYRWIEAHGVPHYFVQIFFDSAWLLSFETLLRIISEPGNRGSRFTIEKNQRNQFKTTIHIPIKEGIQISARLEEPAHASARRQLSSGRLLFYVKFAGGQLVLNRERFLAALSGP